MSSINYGVTGPRFTESLHDVEASLALLYIRRELFRFDMPVSHIKGVCVFATNVVAMAMPVEISEKRRLNWSSAIHTVQSCLNRSSRSWDDTGLGEKVRGDFRQFALKIGYRSNVPWEMKNERQLSASIFLRMLKTSWRLVQLVSFVHVDFAPYDRKLVSMVKSLELKRGLDRLSALKMLSHSVKRLRKPVQ